MSKAKQLQGKLWVKVLAFLLAMVFGIGVCAGFGGLVYTMNSYPGRYETSYEESDECYWNMSSKRELVEEYVFLSRHAGSLTTAGQERLSTLLHELNQNSTNFRFLVVNETMQPLLYNAGEEEMRQAEEEGWVDIYEYTSYELAKHRNVAYYLDLDKAEDWSVQVGTDSDWASNEYTSNYYYTLQDYVIMRQEASEVTGQEIWGVSDMEPAEEEIDVAAVYEETPAYEEITATETPAAEVLVPALPESAESVGEETDVFYDEYTDQYYVNINGQYYNYSQGGLYVYYRFHPEAMEDYTIYCWLDTELPVEDEFYYGAEYFQKGIQIYNEYFAPTVIFSAIMCLLFGAALVALTWTTGWNQSGELALRGMNKLSVEGVCVWLVCGVCGAVGAIWLAEQLYTGDYGYDQYCLFFGAAGGVAVPFCLAGWMTLTAQLKTKMLLKRSLCWRVWMKLWTWCKGKLGQGWKLVKAFVHGWPLYRKLIFYFCVYTVLYLFWMGVIAWDVWQSVWNPFVRVFAIVIPLLPLIVIACRWAMDWGRMRQQVKKLIEGDFETKLDTARMLPDLREHGEDLNNLSAGLSKAVEERVKSQRFKTELITNVSHDLKTPLTSIINYVDLLKKANIEDETVRGYIEVLDRKSQRLKTLTEDLVEASKAASGTIGVNLEALDVVELVEQAVGEYDERLKQAALTVLIKKPETPFQVKADGRHLWRILDNLLGNCTKYAMPGTRVYLDVSRRGAMGVIELKNISADPLNVPEEELMKRFVRGDSARSTEGSGLGLSIARNLTIAQKGQFQLVVDGDLFKAVVQLPVAE